MCCFRFQFGNVMSFFAIICYFWSRFYGNKYTIYGNNILFLGVIFGRNIFIFVNFFLVFVMSLLTYLREYRGSGSRGGGQGWRGGGQIIGMSMPVTREWPCDAVDAV